MADLSKVWKAKAKAQRRELESLRRTLQIQNQVVQRARWMSLIFRQSRQQCDEKFAGDLSPLSMNVAELDALLDFERVYQGIMNPAAWLPVEDHFWKITTA